jgi:hypothetical protein
MPAALDEGEIAPGVVESREVNDLALGQAHEVSSSTLRCGTPDRRCA